MENHDGPNVTHDPELVAIKSLDASQREYFKKIGKEMYGHLKFKGVDLMNTLKPPKEDLRAFVSNQLDDGIHPSALTEGEHKVMTDNFGPKWYENWGYVEGDLTEIITVDRN
jgi:hypothetical protein|uniref:Uncharacterized protein n=1 Tax=viral metagenome TaxID=1070528 RepID=A0A6C0LVB6_9ZZZZ